MQGKGLIKLFLVLMAAVTIIQYLYILPTRGVERDADEYAKEIASRTEDGQESYVIERIARANYLDSMSSEEVFKIPLLKSYTYDELKKQQLALGLDLKGGMSSVLEVDIKELLISLSNNSKDRTFREALDAATEAKKQSQSDFVTLFANEYQRIGEGKSLAKIFMRNPSLREQINTESSNGDVVRVLRQTADETVKLTFDRLKQRIDKLGVAQPNVSLDADRDLILVEMPGIENPERARNFLQASAKLEFWDVYRINDPGIISAFESANEKLKSSEMDTSAIEEEKTIEYDTIWNYTAYDELGNPTDSSFTLSEKVDPLAGTNSGPLLSVFNLNGVTPEGQMAYPFSVMGTANKNQRKAIMNMLARPDVSILFPQDLEFRWSAKPRVDYLTGQVTKEYELYAIKKQSGSNAAPLEGDRVVSASQSPDPRTGELTVELSMDPQGARIWADMTTKAANDNNREIAIVLDSAVVSCPSVNQPITGGRSSITGNFSVEEANDLANILEIGKLPAKISMIQENTVGPSLGAKNIEASLKSLMIGFGLVIIFMVIYYGGAGIISVMALLLNLFFIFGALASLGTVLTLPGIAGILLTIGMAVDANVIIFERIREEMRAGKSLYASVADGFKNSYSAIIDANVTTILTALVLARFGLGPIKGFAVVLIIGVLSSLFTAVLVGRLMIEWWLKRGRSISFWTGWSKNILANLYVNWLGKRKFAYILSGSLILAGIISLSTKGLDLGVDFKGGYSFNVEFEDGLNVDAISIKKGLADAFGTEPVVKAVDTKNTFNIVTDYLIDETFDGAADTVLTHLGHGLQGVTGGKINEVEFKNSFSEGTTHVVSSSKVGPTIADDIKKSSFYAAIIALVLIFAYIFIRFNKWQFSLGAVAALFHDAFILLGMFSILYNVLPFNLEIDQAFIAALLTVIGYSINDTVVVFDRIREYLGIYTDKSSDDVINMAISSTFSRTIITSLTTLFVVIILLLFGGASIKGFALALVIGILVGTYSSIFVATPIVRDLSKDLKMKSSQNKKSFSKAASSAR